MSESSRIEWTEATWNPVTGCTKVSPGCDHCYAERITERFHGKGSFAVVQRSEEKLYLPLKWRKPRRIFVNSMSDLFHDDVPSVFIAEVFAVMAAASQHTFQLLSKRHGRMRSLLGSDGFAHAVNTAYCCLDSDIPSIRGYPWPLPNVWLGVSVEDQKWADIRIPALLETPAAVRWVSAEPLLGPVDLDRYMSGSEEHGPWSYTEFGVLCSCGAPMRDERCLAPDLGWVVAGGESGPGARPMDQDWARSLRDQCAKAGVPFLFKQWGEYCHQDQLPEDVWSRIDAHINLGQEHHPQPLRVGKKAAGRLLDGVLHDAYPVEAAA